MTRVNVIPPEELADKFLVAEKHEITRVFGLARKAQWEMHKKKQPAAYTLGSGHVLFLYDKLTFVAKRYDSLCKEMVKRGFNCTQIPENELLEGIGKHMMWDYKPTPEAIAINRQRIKERS
jgi:deoxyribonuclease (pyrimidine dimer)